MVKKIVIPFPDKMSSHIKELPAGSIKKSATGMGATHLELFLAERNSIVISPLLSIIKSKDDYRVFQFTGKTTEKEFETYVLNCQGFQKIHCSADSIEKMFNFYKALGIFPFQRNFFLLVDEIDLFQTQADFRERLPKVIDFFKKFSPDKRAIISALMYKFFDPDLNSLEKTEISYNTQPSRKIELHITDNPDSELISVLHDLLCNTTDKIFVFYNSVKGIASIINNLNLSSADATVYCGSSSESIDQVREYYSEFEKAPGKRVNFYTSACFSGCDIELAGTLVTVSNCTANHKTLLMSQIFQIGGRLRTGINRDILITNLDSSIPKLDLSKIEINLLKRADEDLAIANRINSLKDQFLGREEFFYDIIKNQTSNGQLLVRFNSSHSIELDYLTIDGEFIKAASRIFYKDETSLKQFLNPRFHFEIISTVRTKFGVKSRLLTKTDIFNQIIIELSKIKSQSTSTQEEARFQNTLLSKSGLAASTFIKFAMQYGLNELKTTNGVKSKMMKVEVRSTLKKDSSWRSPFKIGHTYNEKEIREGMSETEKHLPSIKLKLDGPNLTRSLKLVHDVRRTRDSARNNAYRILR